MALDHDRLDRINAAADEARLDLARRRAEPQQWQTREPLSGYGSPQPDRPKVHPRADILSPATRSALHALADEAGKATGQLERELSTLRAHVAELRADHTVELQHLRNELAALRRELNDVHVRDLNLAPFEMRRVSH